SHLEGIFSGGEANGLPDLTRQDGSLRGAIAPHIDFERGGPTYAHIYKVIGEEASASLFVIFGTVHASTEMTYTATSKHFETPMGKVMTDRASVERLTRRYGRDLFRDEFAHRSEHSIEFQVVFLRYLFPDLEISILPILCGGFHEHVTSGRSPMDDPAVADFIEAIREVIKESGKKPFFIAGADLAHVGLKFGHSEAPTPESCERLKGEDHLMLDHAVKGDGEAFYRSIQEEGDERNICGLSPIYTLLKVMDKPRGKVIKYAQSPDPTLPSVVSYAGVAYY
ncbi:MAG: AmmeMemoRadiSam system protein B, partial [Planctomycetota bacterium]|nr:AmmeMemoRadiSam system protein B [Planctomycetota bacterium]